MLHTWVRSGGVGVARHQLPALACCLHVELAMLVSLETGLPICGHLASSLRSLCSITRYVPTPVLNSWFLIGVARSIRSSSCSKHVAYAWRIVFDCHVDLACCQSLRTSLSVVSVDLDSLWHPLHWCQLWLHLETLLDRGLELVATAVGTLAWFDKHSAPPGQIVAWAVVRDVCQWPGWLAPGASLYAPALPHMLVVCGVGGTGGHPCCYDGLRWSAFDAQCLASSATRRPAYRLTSMCVFGL